MTNDEKQMKKLLTFADDSGLAIFEELQELNDALEGINKTFKGIDLTQIKVIQGEPGEKGQDADEERVIKTVLAKVPKGEDGKDGKTPTREDLINLIKPLVPEAKAGKDGLNADDEYIISEVLRRIPKAKDGKDGSPDTATELVSKLNSLPEADKLQLKDLGGYIALLKKFEDLRQVAGRQMPITTTFFSLNGQIIDRAKNINFISGSALNVTILGDTATVVIPTGGGGGVQSVTGLNTDNTDPQNPIVQISVDGITVFGQGTPGSPLQASATGQIPITYANLLIAIAGNTIIPGQKYLITDYVTSFQIPGDLTRTVTGGVEPLIVIGATVSTLEAQAWSTLFPEDIIYYAVIDSTVNAATDGSSTGRILYRKNPANNIETYYDFRNVKFYRPKFDYDITGVVFPVTPQSLMVDGNPISLVASAWLLPALSQIANTDDLAKLLHYAFFHYANFGIVAGDDGTNGITLWSTHDGHILGDLILTDSSGGPDVVITPNKTDLDFYTFGNQVDIQAYGTPMTLIPAIDGNQITGNFDVSVGITNGDYAGTSFANFVFGEKIVHGKVGAETFNGTIATSAGGTTYDVEVGADGNNILVGSTVQTVKMGIAPVSISIIGNCSNIEIGIFCINLFIQTGQNIYIGEGINQQAFPAGQSDKRVTWQYSNFEATVAPDVAGDIDVNLNFYRYVGIYHISSDANDLNSMTGMNVVEHPVTIIPSAGVTALNINDISVSGTGNIYLEIPGTITLDGDKEQAAVFSRGINNTAKVVKVGGWIPFTT